ncbi:tetratricopeptide repeat protein [Chryseobacterium vrystaatense]|uniref:Tetratricopeptide repeat-containing protein n=1 Tax=Chryseobacterium vrystaatense TaxID=307480 RepID=A0ABR4UKQ3_9FLAO|nr:hypothetical protein [Chryseobacterium vrystaatense]KFF25325.1 hypothetical protein IW16_15045 [Chryseobacterium vrystaatense]
MSKYISFFVIFILTQTSAQINKLQLNDNWTRVKFSMLDGSRDLSQSPRKILRWQISDSKLCEYKNIIFEDQKECNDIKIENKSIRTSEHAFYEIEKLTIDSLVVILRVNGVTNSDKINKIWFVRTSKLYDEYFSKIKNDSIIEANRSFTPTLKKNIFYDITGSSKFNIKGNIVIYPKKQKIDFQQEIKEGSQNNAKGIELLKTTIEKSFHLWNITAFKNFDQVLIPYSITRYTSSEGSSLGVDFFKDDNKSNNNIIPVKIENRTLSDQTYSKGIGALNEQKLDKAINLFNKAFDLDNTNVDALYNIASISLNKNDIPTACTALKKLKDLEQTEGTKIFNERCSKN